MASNSFSTLSLSDDFLRNLNELGFQEMTPIQQQSLPYILESDDIIAQAKTGSGKTAAFGIGVLNKLDVTKCVVQALILCPTWELSDQIAKELQRLSRFAQNVKVLTLCGGASIRHQEESLEHGAHVIVGTPGRLLQHLRQKSLSLESLETLVVDEAHHMLEMGFIEEITQVIAYAPKKRQTLLFSATYPDEIQQLSASIQNNAIQVQTVSTEVPNQIKECFYQTATTDKFSSLVKVLAHYQPQSAVVFCNTKVQVQDLLYDLEDEDIDARAIHGDLEKYERRDVLIQFANQSCTLLVATDVAARGLDIKDLEMVINYDLPQDEATYTHRIGRTGRAGEKGVAVTLFTPHEASRLKQYRNESRVFEDESVLNTDRPFTRTPSKGTLVIEGGKKNKLRPGDILGALTGDIGIEGKDIGKIDIFDKQSYVAIDLQRIEHAYKKLKKGKIKARRFSVWLLK